LNVSLLLQNKYKSER